MTAEYGYEPGAAGSYSIVHHASLDRKSPCYSSTFDWSRPSAMCYWSRRQASDLSYCDDCLTTFVITGSSEHGDASSAVSLLFVSHAGHNCFR